MGLNNVTDYLDFLFDLIKREIAYQEEILGVAREKKKLLLANHLEELVSCLRQEETLILQAKDIEEEMRQVWKKMCDEHTLDLPEFRLSSLIDIVDAEQARAWQEAKDHLTSIVRELDETNRQNAVLIQEALDYVNIVFSLLLEDPTEKAGNLGYTFRKEKENSGKTASGRLIDGTV